MAANAVSALLDEAGGCRRALMDSSCARRPTRKLYRARLFGRRLSTLEHLRNTSKQSSFEDTGMSYDAAVPPVESERHLRTEDSQLFPSVGSSFNLRDCSAPLKTESSCRRLDSAESHEGILKMSSKEPSPLSEYVSCDVRVNIAVVVCLFVLESG